MEFTLALEFTFSSQPFLSSYMDIVDTPAGSHIIVRIRNCTNQQKLIDALRRRGHSWGDIRAALTRYELALEDEGWDDESEL